LTLLLQLVILAVTVERRVLKAETSPNAVIVSTPAGVAVLPLAENGSPQDHDSEERGLLRTETNVTENIELRPLGSSQEHETGNESTERDELLAEPSASTGGDSKDHPLDAFNTGEYVIADLHVLDTTRKQWSQFANMPAATSESSATSSPAAMVAAAAGRRFGFQLRVGGQVLGQ